MTCDVTRTFYPKLSLLLTYHFTLTDFLTHLYKSQGMTSDMDEAVAAGSSSVRLGSSVFGAREWPVGAQ